MKTPPGSNLPLSRPATHAELWYSGEREILEHQLRRWLAGAEKARTERAPLVCLGPHAGYRFCGEVMGYTYTNVPENTKRIVLLGPSHMQYFRGLRTTMFTQLETPLGVVDVDTAGVAKLLEAEVGNPKFGILESKVDESEHCWEMHLPFIKLTAPKAKVVPLLLSGNSGLKSLSQTSIALMKSWLKDPETLFVVSGDFCHWGPKFDYTPFVGEKGAISESIETMDLTGLDVLRSGSSKEWEKYLKITGNTICGRQPLLFMLELGEANGTPLHFELLKYAQSSKAEKDGMSVSYVSAIAF